MIILILRSFFGTPKNDDLFKNSEHFIPNDFYCNLAKYGVVAKEDLQNLNVTLQKHRNVTSLSFYTNKIGRHGSIINDLIVSLTRQSTNHRNESHYNSLLDRHIKKIIESLSSDRLANLGLEMNANFLTEKRFRGVLCYC